MDAGMAQKVITSFVDDIDGSAAEGTVRFALDGDEYEIDLSAEHTAALRTALESYVAAARKSARSRPPVRRARRVPASGLNSTEVREWAKSQGIDVKERGRIPAELVVKFQAAASTR
jgi:tRNA threonylcarbamoyladenosine modification (KEOPS) complex  Pcc1 subunit